MVDSELAWLLRVSTMSTRCCIPGVNVHASTRTTSSTTSQAVRNHGLEVTPYAIPVRLC